MECRSGPCTVLPYGGCSAVSFFMKTIICIFSIVFNNFLNRYRSVKNSDLVLSPVVL